MPGEDCWDDPAGAYSVRVTRIDNYFESDAFQEVSEAIVAAGESSRAAVIAQQVARLDECDVTVGASNTCTLFDPDGRATAHNAYQRLEMCGSDHRWLRALCAPELAVCERDPDCGSLITDALKSTDGPPTDAEVRQAGNGAYSDLYSCYTKVCDWTRPSENVVCTLHQQGCQLEMDCGPFGFFTGSVHGERALAGLIFPAVIPKGHGPLGAPRRRRARWPPRDGAARAV